MEYDIFLTSDCIPRKTFLSLKDEQNSSKDLVLKSTLFKNKSHQSTNKTFIKRYSHLNYENDKVDLSSQYGGIIQNRSLMEKYVSVVDKKDSCN